LANTVLMANIPVDPKNTGKAACPWGLITLTIRAW